MGPRGRATSVRPVIEKTQSLLEIARGRHQAAPPHGLPDARDVPTEAVTGFTDRVAKTRLGKNVCGGAHGERRAQAGPKFTAAGRGRPSATAPPDTAAGAAC